MRIHADITATTASAIADIKKVLIKHFGDKFNDTGHVLGYCVSCTVQSLNEHYAAQQKELKKIKGEMNDQVEMGTGTSSGVQDSPVDGSGHDIDKGDINSSEPHEASADGPVDPEL